jgi:hypothetical protein
MRESSKSKQHSPASRDDLRGERQQRGVATTPAPAEQFGATEQQVTPLTPPTSEKPAKKMPPVLPQNSGLLNRSIRPTRLHPDN